MKEFYRCYARLRRVTVLMLRMKNPFPVSLVALLLWMLLPLSAAACDCVYVGPPCKGFEKTPIVFVGRVTKISTIDLKATSGDDYKDRLVSFEVEKSYRGGVTNTAEVLADSNSDCDYRFQEGVRYLVYAYPHRSTGKLVTSICTRPISEAAEDLEYLSKKDDPSHGAGIEGSIEELDSKNRIQVVGFLEGIMVLVDGPSGRQTVISKKDGRFQLWGLSPGSYRVTPVLPKLFLPDEQTVKVVQNSCAEVRLLATPRAHLP